MKSCEWRSVCESAVNENADCGGLCFLFFKSAHPQRKRYTTGHAPTVILQNLQRVQGGKSVSSRAGDFGANCIRLPRTNNSFCVQSDTTALRQRSAIIIALGQLCPWEINTTRPVYTYIIVCFWVCSVWIIQLVLLRYWKYRFDIDVSYLIAGRNIEIFDTSVSNFWYIILPNFHLFSVDFRYQRSVVAPRPQFIN